MTTPYIPPVAGPKTRELMETLGWLKVSSKNDALETWALDNCGSDIDRATYHWLVAQPSADPHHWWDVRGIVLADFPLLTQEDYDAGKTPGFFAGTGLTGDITVKPGTSGSASLLRNGDTIAEITPNIRFNQNGAVYVWFALTTLSGETGWGWSTGLRC